MSTSKLHPYALSIAFLILFIGNDAITGAPVYFDSNINSTIFLFNNNVFYRNETPIFSINFRAVSFINKC